MTCLNVMITDNTDIVAYEIDHVGYAVVIRGGDGIKVIGCWFALQDIATVNKYSTYRIGFELLSNKSVYPLQTAFPPAFVTKVVWEVVTVDICCEYYSDLSFVVQ